MGKARMDVVIASDRMHLCLAPETSECSGKNDPVVIFMEGAARWFFRAVQGFSETFAVEQGLPIQGVYSMSKERLACVFTARLQEV
jgi:hypothetical protein